MSCSGAMGIKGPQTSVSTSPLPILQAPGGKEQEVIPGHALLVRVRMGTDSPSGTLPGVPLFLVFLDSCLGI